MDEFDVDKLINDNLSGGMAGNGFRERVLRESTGALKRGVVFRRRVRTVGLTLSVLLIAGGAFFLGHLSGSTPGIVAKGQEGRTSVPTELVAWLDAGRFFEQLGMQERANKAYEEASVLIPYEASERWRAMSEGNKFFARVPAGVSADGSSGRSSEWTKSLKAMKAAGGEFERTQKGLERFIAQCLGG